MTKCLICLCPTTYSSSHHSHHHSSDPPGLLSLLPDSGGPPSPCLSLNEEVDYFYFIYKFLGLSSEICEELLETHGSPSTWFSLCGDCHSAFLLEGKGLFHQIQELQRRHGDLGQRALGRMRVKVEEEECAMVRNQVIVIDLNTHQDDDNEYSTTTTALDTIRRACLIKTPTTFEKESLDETHLDHNIHSEITDDDDDDDYVPSPAPPTPQRRRSQRKPMVTKAKCEEEDHLDTENDRKPEQLAKVIEKRRKSSSVKEKVRKQKSLSVFPKVKVKVKKKKRRAKAVHEGEEPGFKKWKIETCFECKKRKLAPGENLEDHIRRVHAPPDVRSCAGCGQVLVTVQEYLDHVEKAELEDPSFRCVTTASPCPLPFCLGKTPRVIRGSQEALAIHLKAVHYIPEPAVEVGRVYKCDLCGAQYNTKVARDKHLKRDHIDPLEKCDRPNCPTVLRGKVRMRRHVRDAHFVEEKLLPPPNCPECGKEFKSKRHLARHKKLHVAETLFLCQECGKGYKVFDQLRTHMWSHDQELYREKYGKYKANALKRKGGEVSAGTPSTGGKRFKAMDNPNRDEGV